MVVAGQTGGFGTFNVSGNRGMATRHNLKETKLNVTYMIKSYIDANTIFQVSTKRQILDMNKRIMEVE